MLSAETDTWQRSPSTPSTWQIPVWQTTLTAPPCSVQALEHAEALAGQGGASLSAFNAILNACGRAKSQQLADRCLAAMHRQGVGPTAQTHAEVMKVKRLSASICRL